MAENSNIEWTDNTWNPWVGCTKVSPGCAHCYAELLASRFALAHWGRGKPRTKNKNWETPRLWNTRSPRQGRYTTVFPSMCDWLDEEVPIEWLAEFLRLIRETPGLHWLLLSKRPENFSALLSTAAICVPGNDDRFDGMINMVGEWGTGTPPKNVALGTSVEDQQCADERIPELLKTPAVMRFLSVEPLLGPVDLREHLPNEAEYEVDQLVWPDWVIVGGESGPRARPCKIEWIDAIVKQCKAAGVPCFVKQVGTYSIVDNANLFDFPADARLEVEKKLTGFASARFRSPLHSKDMKGGGFDYWPDQIKVRELPAMLLPKK